MYIETEKSSPLDFFDDFSEMAWYFIIKLYTHLFNVSIYVYMPSKIWRNFTMAKLYLVIFANSKTCALKSHCYVKMMIINEWLVFNNNIVHSCYGYNKKLLSELLFCTLMSLMTL